MGGETATGRSIGATFANTNGSVGNLTATGGGNSQVSIGECVTAPSANLHLADVVAHRAGGSFRATGMEIEPPDGCSVVRSEVVGGSITDGGTTDGAATGQYRTRKLDVDSSDQIVPVFFMSNFISGGAGPSSIGVMHCTEAIVSNSGQ